MAWVTCAACQCQHYAGPDRPCPLCGAAPLVAAGASVPVDGVVTFAEPPLPVVPVLRRATAHRCRVSASSACEVCGQPVPVEPLTRRDLVDSVWLRGVARYLRQRASNGIQAVLVEKLAQRVDRIASDLDWCMGLVVSIEEQYPGADNEIAALAMHLAPCLRCGVLVPGKREDSPACAGCTEAIKREISAGTADALPDGETVPRADRSLDGPGTFPIQPVPGFSAAPCPDCGTGCAEGVCSCTEGEGTRSPEGPGDQGKRPIYSAPPGGEWD